MPSEKQRERARSEMEKRHQRELLELQEKQNREKLDMMQELLSGVTIPSSEEGQPQKSKSVNSTVERETKSNRDGNTSSYTRKTSVDSNANNSTSKSVTSMQSEPVSNIDNPPDRATLEAHKSAEIKAIMRDKSLDREARRRSLEDIKSKYSKLLANVSGDTSSVNSAQQRKLELQAIMKDRSLPKEERLKKLAEVKKKYPLDEGHRRATLDTMPRAKMAADIRFGKMASMPDRDENEEKKRGSRSKQQEVVEDQVMDEAAVEQDDFNASSKKRGKAAVKVATANKASRKEDYTDKAALEKDNSNASSNKWGAVGAKVSRKDQEEAAEETQSDKAASQQEDTVSSEEGEYITELSSSLTPRRRSTELESSSKFRRRSSEDDSADEIEVLSSTLKGGRWSKEPSTNMVGYVPTGRRKSNESTEKHVTISEPNSANTSARSLIDLENAEVNKTPIKTLIRKLEKNDPNTIVLRLDGRGKIKEGDWKTFFEALENNTTLTHLSLARCGLTDDLVVGLILALVENLTLTTLHLMSNKDITESKCCYSITFVLKPMNVAECSSSITLFSTKQLERV
jgi:hypothetical protein